MRLWQPITRIDHDDCELLDAVLTAEAFEALDWYFARACHELNEFSALTVIEVSESLPEDLHWLRVSCVASLIRCVLSQIVNVNDLESGYEKLKLPIVEDLDQVFGNDGKHAVLERVELLRDLLLQPIVGD